MSYYTFSDVVRKCYLDIIRYHYFGFRGRARRSEYWFFFLLMSIPMMVFYFLTIVGVAVAQVAETSGGEPGLPILAMVALLLMTLWNLFHVIPSLGLTVRRLHDTGRSAWYLLLTLIPMVGPVIFLVFMCLDSQPGVNKYGYNPKGVGGQEVEIFG